MNLLTRLMIPQIIKFIRFFSKKGRGVLFYTPVFLLVFALSSCGIGSYPVLYEPVITSLSSTSPLTFSHDYRNNPDSFLVLGYDIYYRIYDDDALDPTSYNDQIRSDAAAELNETAIGNLLAKNWNQMGHYRRIYLSDSNLEKTAPPTFLLNSSTPQNFSIYLYLEGADKYIKNGFDTSTLYFSRYLGDVGGNPVTEDFSASDFSIDDPDVFETATTSYRVAFFSLTYGLTNDLQSLHSSVVYIGSYTYN